MEFRINRLAIGAQGDDGWIQRKAAKPQSRKDAKSGWNDSRVFALIFMQRGTVNTLRKNVTLVVKRIKTGWKHRHHTKKSLPRIRQGF